MFFSFSFDSTWSPNKMYQILQVLCTNQRWNPKATRHPQTPTFAIALQVWIWGCLQKHVSLLLEDQTLRHSLNVLFGVILLVTSYLLAAFDEPSSTTAFTGLNNLFKETKTSELFVDHLWQAISLSLGEDANALRGNQAHDLIPLKSDGDLD